MIERIPRLVNDGFCTNSMNYILSCLIKDLFFQIFINLVLPAKAMIKQLFFRD